MNQENDQGYLKSYFEGFRDFSSEPEELWSRLEQRLDKKSRRRALWIWWIPMVLVLLAGFALLSPIPKSIRMAGKEKGLGSDPMSLRQPERPAQPDPGLVHTGKSSGQTQPNLQALPTSEQGKRLNSSNSLSNPAVANLPQSVQRQPASAFSPKASSAAKFKPILSISSPLSTPTQGREHRTFGPPAAVLPQAKAKEFTQTIDHANRQEDLASGNRTDKTGGTQEDISKDDPNPLSANQTDRALEGIPEVDSADVLADTTHEYYPASQLKAKPETTVPKGLRFFVLTGPLNLSQNIRYIQEAPGAAIPNSFSPSYGWFVSGGYMEPVLSWFKAGLQTQVSLAQQSIGFTEKVTGQPTLQVDPATGVISVKGTTSVSSTASRWLFLPSAAMVLDVHSRSEQWGIRLGGGIRGWQGISEKPLILRPEASLQLYTRLKTWECRFSVDRFSVQNNAIPKFNTASGSNTVIGFGIGRWW
jgi:hypothetical protein